MNEQITAPRVLVISPAGKQMGVMPLRDALRLARDQGLDLVEVAPNADPPVCRILDYGKLKYLQSKKEREAKKAHRSAELKEIRLRPNIGEHDFQARIRKVVEFLEEGDKVKVSVMFRGREMAHPEAGVALLKRVAEAVKELARLEGPPSKEGRFLSMILTARPRKSEQPRRPQQTQEKEAQEVANA